MDFLANFIIDHAAMAHWIVFTSLILAGFNLPISEDLMIIISAILAASVVPENTFKLLAFIFMGAYFSDMIVYWIGRLLGRNLWKWKWFANTVSYKRLDQIQNFYKKRGIFTLLIGRFIPFGVRNCLFLTAGIGKMNFGKFLIGDCLACMLSNSTLFFITYYFGRNIQSAAYYLKILNIIIFAVFAITLISIFWYSKKRKKKANIDSNEQID